MAAPVLVQSETCCPKGQTHPRSSECDCGQIVSTRPNNSDRMVSSSGGIRPPVSNLASSPGRHVCDQVQFQANQVCVSSTRPQCLGSGRSNGLLGELGHVCLSPSIVAGQSGQQTVRPFNKARHRDLTSFNLHAWPLGPRQSRSRGSLAQWRYKLRLLKDVQPEQSEVKWSVFVRWCETSQVDLRSPSIKQVTDFLLHLFQKNLPLMVTGQQLQTN